MRRAALETCLDRVMRWPTPASRDWVSSFIGKAATSPDIVAVVAIGSAIRPGVESDDVDLLVVYRGETRPRWRPPIEVDLRPYELTRVDHDLAEGADLITWAVKYGMPLYDPEAAWRGITRRWEGRLQLPDPVVADERGRATLAQVRALEAVGDLSAASEVRVSYLTHVGRAALARAGVFPASRPELPGQLRRVGEYELARRLDGALSLRRQIAAETTAV